jgi:hypothetical protein
MADAKTPDADASVVLEDVLVLYPHLHEPHLPRGSAADAKPTYQLTALLPPGYDMSDLMRIALAAATKAFGEGAARMLKAGAIKSPFRSQAEKAAEGKEGFSEHPDAKYINVKSERQPGVIDQRMQKILDPSKVYGGCSCNVQVNCFAWNHPTGGKGLSFGLQNVQLVREGPHLGGGANPDPKSVFKPLAMPETGEKADADIRSIFG